MPERINEDLVQSVGLRSFKFFNIMRLGPGFLSLPVETGELDSSFNEAKLTVSNLVVVNDGAERGIKLGHDCINSRKQEGVLQNILQIVENIRARIPDMRQRRKQTKEKAVVSYARITYSTVDICTVLCFKSVKLTTAV